MAQGLDPLFGLRANDLGERTLNLGRSTLQSGGCSGKASDPGCLPCLQLQPLQRLQAMALPPVLAMAEPSDPLMVVSPDQSRLEGPALHHHVSVLIYMKVSRGQLRIHRDYKVSWYSSRAILTGLRLAQ